MKITQKDVQYVAGLANLELSNSERAHLETELNAILEYIDHLTEVDTSNVDPVTQVTQIASPADLAGDGLRSDDLRECLPRDCALANAPQTDGEFFLVPKVIER
jgi:aspartyl-tRNA(Asn)/glutamyl-tRNA(Gln) amidotransferase subunit C